MTKTGFAASVKPYEAALMSLFAGKPKDTEADLSAFVAHIRWIRKILPAVTPTVTQFLHDGAQLAERHTSSTTLLDGTGKRW